MGSFSWATVRWASPSTTVTRFSTPARLKFALANKTFVVIYFMGNQFASRGLEAQAQPEGRVAVRGADLHDILGIRGLGQDAQQSPVQP